MRASMATDPGDPGVPNEDWAGFTPDMAVVIDGVTTVSNGGSCEHGTPWYVRQLGQVLLTAEPGFPLGDLLSAAISHVAGLHGGCDLASDSAPSAAVAMLRLTGDRADYLMLADVTVVLETGAGVSVVTDDRVSASVSGVDPLAPDVSAQITARRAADRNRRGGYWVAAADPEAASHAVTGSVTGLRRAAVMTDGASRIADMFGMPWEKTLGMDPADLITEVRRCESDDRDRWQFPRFKISDDATAVLWCR